MEGNIHPTIYTPETDRQTDAHASELISNSDLTRRKRDIRMLAVTLAFELETGFELIAGISLNIIGISYSGVKSIPSLSFIRGKMGHPLYSTLALTLICLTKNLVYKNIEAQMRKKIRTIVRTSSASDVGESKNI